MTKKKINQTAHEIGAHFALTCDLTLPGSAREVTQQVVDKFGGLDILVTNTGGPKKGRFLDVTLDQWKGDFQSLWLSVVESLHVALPVMEKNNFGRILMVTSVAAKEPLPELTTSNGLRPGLAGLAKSISNEYASSGVTVNLILPGYTNTQRLKDLKLSDDKIRSLIPAGRLGEPSEIGDLVSFLASPKGAYINGQSLSVDGGALKSI